MRRYTQKDARGYSAAYIDPTRLEQERQKEFKLHVACIKHFKGEEPNLPDGVTKTSEEGLKLYKKAAEQAAEAVARRKYMQKKSEEEAKRARLRDSEPRSPSPSSRSTLGHTRVEKPKRLTVYEKIDIKQKARLDVVLGYAKKQQHSANKKGSDTSSARVVNIRGRKVLCDSDDEDELELINKVGAPKGTEVKGDGAPAKRKIVDVDADGSLSDELLKNKRRRGDFSTVRPESDKENQYEKRTPRFYLKAPGSPSPMPRDCHPSQLSTQRVIATPKPPSEKLRDASETRRTSNANILASNWDKIKKIKASKYPSATWAAETRPTLAGSPSKQKKAERPARSSTLSTPSEVLAKIRKEEKRKDARLRKEIKAGRAPSVESSSSSRSRQRRREDPKKEKRSPHPYRDSLEPGIRAAAGVPVLMPHLVERAERRSRSSSSVESPLEQHPSKGASAIDQVESIVPAKNTPNVELEEGELNEQV